MTTLKDKVLGMVDQLRAVIVAARSDTGEGGARKTKVARATEADQALSFASRWVDDLEAVVAEEKAAPVLVETLLARYMVARSDQEFRSWMGQGRHVTIPIVPGMLDDYAYNGEGFVASVRAEIISRTGNEIHVKVLSAVLADGTGTRLSGDVRMTVTADKIAGIVG